METLEQIQNNIQHQDQEDITQQTAGFADRLLGILNNGATGIMISLGHRTGLFDVMAGMAPANSKTIAEAAGLHERYVREWLGAMTVSGIVECDLKNGTYHLPASHAAGLTRAAGADNMAVFAQYLPVLASVEDEVLRCFREGGGVPYEKYHRFHEVMAEDSGQSVLPALFDSILPLASGLTERLEEGIDVLDIGCGSGRALIMMAERFPRSRFLGIDLCAEPLEKASALAREKGLINAHFRQADLTDFPVEGRFELITAFDAIHDQARPDQVLSGVRAHLAEGGTFLMQDIDGHSHPTGNMEHPLGPLLYTISTMHCMTVSLAQGGMGLGTMWGRDTAARMLEAAGFTEVKSHLLPHDPQNRYYVCR